MRVRSLIAKEIKYKLLLAIGCYMFFGVLFETGMDRTYAKSEIMFVALSMATCAYLFDTNDEMELIILSKVSLKNIFLVRFICTYLSMAIMPSIHIFVRTKDSDPNRSVLSFVTTVLFCCALGAFWRAMLSSSFSALMFSSACCTLLVFPNYVEINDMQSYYNVGPLYSANLSDDLFVTNRFLVVLYSAVMVSASYYKLHKKEKV